MTAKRLLFIIPLQDREARCVRFLSLSFVVSEATIRNFAYSYTAAPHAGLLLFHSPWWYSRLAAHCRIGGPVTLSFPRLPL